VHVSIADASNPTDDPRFANPQQVRKYSMHGSTTA
jgi:hypothetical protein